MSKENESMHRAAISSGPYKCAEVGSKVVRHLTSGTRRRPLSVNSLRWFLGSCARLGRKRPQAPPCLTKIELLARYASRPSGPSSLPRPLCLRPPNGAAGSSM